MPELMELTPNAIKRVRIDVTNSRMKGLAMQPFFASVALQLNIYICRLAQGRPVATAAVAGPNLYVNPDWYMALKRAQKVGLVMHEVLHKALGHDLRRGDRHPDVWNYACDYYINLILRKNKFELPEDGLIDYRFDQMSEEHIFSYMWERATFIEPGQGEPSQWGSIDPDNLVIIKAGKPQPGGQQGDKQSGNSSGRDGNGTDQQPDQQAGAADGGAGEGKGKAQGGADSDPSGSGGGHGDPSQSQGQEGADGGGDRQEGAGGGVDTTPQAGEGEIIDRKESLNVGWGEVWDAQDETGRELTKSEREVELQKLKQDMVMSAKANPNAGASDVLTGKRIMDNLIRPKTDWKKELRSFFSDTGKPKGRSYYRLDRRALAQDRYEPAEYSQKMGKSIALWDVSSSMHWPAHRALHSQLTRMRDTIEMEELTIAPFNNRVQTNHVVKLKSKDKLPEEFAVGGGTSFNKAFAWVNGLPNKPDGVIVFTDLGSRITLPKPPYPVLWVSSNPVTDYNRPPWGKVVVIEVGDRR